MATVKDLYQEIFLFHPSQLYEKAREQCQQAYGEHCKLMTRILSNTGIYYEDRKDYYTAYDFFVKWKDLSMEVGCLSVSVHLFCLCWSQKEIYVMMFVSVCIVIVACKHDTPKPTSWLNLILGM